MKNTFIIRNANGIAMDTAKTRFTAVAVEHGKIRAVGHEADMAAFVNRGWPVQDLGGKTLLPGFVDCHQHLGMTGQVLDGVDLSFANSLQDVYDALADTARRVPHGEWISAYSLNDLALRELRMPTGAELDAVCPENPVMVVQCSWHLCSLNSRALEALSLPESLDGRDMENGRPTGLVRDPGSVTYVFPALCRKRSDESKISFFAAAGSKALKYGVTTLHALEGGEYGPGEAALLAANSAAIPQHLVLWNQVMDIEETKALKLPRIGGCICADGAIDSYTAAFFEPYDNQPWHCGTLNYTQQQMDDFILRAHEEGLQIAVHCESDRSIEQVLSAMEKAQGNCPRKDHRHRIEHVEFPAPEQLERMASAGIIASMQPAFLPCLVDMDDYLLRVGPKRLRWMHPYRTLLDLGVRICGGSDSPVTPGNPLVGVQGAVLHPVEQERVSVEEALRMFTLDAAFSAFEETSRGSIEPDKLADLVVLDEDPLTVDPETLGSIGVVRTYVEGELVEQPRDGPVN